MRIEFNIEGGISGALKAMDLAAARRHVDEGAKPGIGAAEAANENLMLRHLLELKVDGADDFDGEFDRARKRCPTLASRVADILVAAGGVPLKPPARKMVDVLNADTPPAVLRAAGLDLDQVEKLVAEFGEYQLRLIQVRDQEGVKLYSLAVRSPDPDEIGIVAQAQRAGRGLGDALLSLCDACIIWSREPHKALWERAPCAPFHTVGYEIAELAGGSADIQFRARR